VGIVVDLFAGGGGASTGIEAALGRSPDVAINHDPVALAVHEANHPDTEHRVESIWQAFPAEVAKRRAIDLLWASPDCKHHSKSKGGKPRDAKIRSLAWVVVDWAQLPKWQRPKVILMENVEEFLDWGPLDSEGYPIEDRKGETYQQWLGALELLGYTCEHRILVASHFGAPTTRKRWFFAARCDGEPIRWPAPTHGPGLQPFRTAAECIDWSIPVPSIFDRKKPLAAPTCRRIAWGIVDQIIASANPFTVPQGYAPTLIQTGRGEREGQRPRYLDIHKPLGVVQALGNKHALCAAFLVKNYGDRGRPEKNHWLNKDLRAPIGTITATDHHSLVSAPLDGGERAEQVYAFLIKYYKTGTAVSLREPMHTLTTKHRMALVVVNGIERVIGDIGLRMLHARPELLRAQFGRFAETYDMSAATTQKDEQRLIGNSVCPEVAEALVRANFNPVELRRAA
jgi:DNA (cytosine-5)-methyltransferase 1